MSGNQTQPSATNPEVPLIVGATEIVGGEIVVCLDNMLGPVVARFPRTAEGHRAALALVQS